MATVISSFHLKGGTGKTSTLTSLAVVLAATRQSRVVVFDLDILGALYRSTTRREVKVYAEPEEHFNSLHGEGLAKIAIPFPDRSATIEVAHLPIDALGDIGDLLSFKRFIDRNIGREDIVCLDLPPLRRSPIDFRALNAFRDIATKYFALVCHRPQGAEMVIMRQFLAVWKELFSQLELPSLTTLEIENMGAPRNVLVNKQRALLERFQKSGPIWVHNVRGDTDEREAEMAGAAQSKGIPEEVGRRYMVAGNGEDRAAIALPKIEFDGREFAEGYSPLLLVGADLPLYLAGESRALRNFRRACEALEYLKQRSVGDRLRESFGNEQRIQLLDQQLRNLGLSWPMGSDWASFDALGRASAGEFVRVVDHYSKEGIGHDAFLLQCSSAFQSYDPFSPKHLQDTALAHYAQGIRSLADLIE